MSDPCPAEEAAIVLGARVRPDGTPGPALIRRVERAVRLVEAGRVGHLVMCGGPVGHPVPEASLMRDLAIAAGIDPARIVVEPYSRDTIGNARHCLPILARHGWRRVVVVTDPWHLPRALYIFRRLGIVAGAVAARPAGRFGRDGWRAMIHEALALPWTVIRVERWRLATRRRRSGPA